MFFFRKQKFEGGHKKFEGRATKYADNPKDLQHLLKRALRKASLNKSSLSGILQQLYLLVELVKAWSKKEYRDVSKKTIIMVIATIVYFVAPFDLIPDFLIGLGIFDDVAVIGYTVKQISNELDAFKNWKENSSTIL
ncbi:MAG: YkvA family protein [Bacillus sp. (in: firmicutes)]